MPNWTQCLQAFVVLAITGFTLVIVSYHWLLIAIFLIAACVASRRLRHQP